jgi:mannose-6-phosphate isomerase-like protein (cupin superfamily)
MNIKALTLAALLVLPAGGSTASAQARKPAPQARQPARSTMTITVTDLEGKTIPGVWVKASGPVDREAPTDESGLVTFRNMNTGTYRLRFEHDEFVTLEREVTQTAKPLPVNVSLNAAPPKPPPAPEQPETPPTGELPPAGPPTSVSIPDFFEKNYLGSAPSQTSVVGCVPGMTTQLLQLRDPLGEHIHENVDELLYIVGGDGTHRIGGRDVPLEAGVLATVPRGTPHSITRRGRNPLVILSITTQPCSVK